MLYSTGHSVDTILCHECVNTGIPCGVYPELTAGTMLPAIMLY